MTKSNQWTFGRIILLSAAFFNFVIIAIWLVVYYDQYEKIETVVKGLWAAILAILGFLGYKTVNKKVSLAEMIGTPPLNILIILTLLLNLAASAVIILWDFKIYTLSISAPDLPDGTDVTIICKNIDTLQVTQKAGDVWQFRLKKGDYALQVLAKGYKSQKLTAHISWPLENKIILKEFSAQSGFFDIRYQPASIPLSLEFKNDSGVVLQQQIQNGSNVLQLEQGSYSLVLTANGYQSVQVPVKIISMDTAHYMVNLKKIDTSGLLEIKSRPADMKIYIDSRYSGFDTPHSFRLTPAVYRIELKKKRSDNFGFYMLKNVQVRATKKVKIDTTLNAMELCKLTLFPQDNNALYYIDDSENAIGHVSGPKTVFVFPGEHRFLKKIDGQIYYSEIINVTTGSNNVIEF
ncbi:MAG: PEGA domain-containing protein [Calditrichae bacterium]|nr:PEGA domain-containing protein [Calditrichia bacterium]